MITGLGNGGAEKVLFRLVTCDGHNEHIVISMMDLGIYGPQLKELGFAVHALEMPRARISMKGLSRLYRLIKSIQPDVIQTWMYHADLIGGIIGRLGGCPAIFWGIRGPYNRARTSLATKCVITLCAWFSGWLRSCSAPGG
mgnify:CR=1 FL=1